MSGTTTNRATFERPSLRIDHGSLVPSNAENIERRIEYPTLDRHDDTFQHISRVGIALENAFRADETKAMFVWCLSRDARVSARIRKYAFNALRRSKALIATKKRKLTNKEKQWRRRFKSFLKTQKNRGLLSNLSRWRNNAKAMDFFEDAQDDLNFYARTLEEWDDTGYGQRAFSARLFEDVKVYMTYTTLRAVGTLPLPSNCKRSVMQKAKETLPYTPITKRRISRRGNENWGTYTNSNWRFHSNSESNSSVSSPRSTGSRSRTSTR